MRNTKSGRFALSAGAVAILAGGLFAAPLAASAAETDALDVAVNPTSEWANGDEQIVSIAASNNTDESGVVDLTFGVSGTNGQEWRQDILGHTSAPTVTIDGSQVPLTWSGTQEKHLSFEVPAGKTALVSAPFTMRAWTTDTHSEYATVSASTLTTSTDTVPGNCQTGTETDCRATWDVPQWYSEELTLASTPATGGTVQAGDTITYSLTALTHLWNANENVVAAADLTDLLTHATLVDGSLQTTSGSVDIDADNRLHWSTAELDPAGVGDNGSGDPETATFQVTVDDDTAEGSALQVIAGGYGFHPLFGSEGRMLEAAMDPTTGAITPTAAATSTLTVAASDDIPVPAITVTGVDDQVNTVGDDVAVQVEASSSDSSALSYSADNLPDGVTIDSATGVISGVPTAAGEYTVTVSASSDSAATVDTTFLWTVSAASAPIPDDSTGADTSDGGTATAGGPSVHTGGALAADADSTAPWVVGGSALLALLAAAAGVIGFRKVRAQRS
ncbi:Ig domain-containing protein [Microbacterium sp. K27]|uniref:Ig domain-containing protein n=1 Tax=Microbacterium sp. K27 TaxID=2305445 RepID=UPI00109BF3DF|nr:Ig domain-containing protein [Microbacterium sp. K27]